MSSRENFEIVATFKNICDNSKYSFVVDCQGKEEIVNNIYLDNLDHFVRQILGCTYYGRYVDDIVIIHKDKDYLKFVIVEIENYLNKKLLLTIHPNKIFLQSTKI